MQLGLVTAFLGGTLALLSPCGALLAPAFLASKAGGGARLVGHAAVFYTGLVVALAPLAVASGVVGRFIATNRSTVVLLTSALLVGLGVMQALGGGFDLARFVPTARRLPEQAATRRGAVRTFALGAASGLVGFCTGPILGAVLTLAAAQGSPAGALALLAVYGAGMVVPMLALAAGWDRLGDRRLRRLRGRTFRAAGRTWHTTSLATGALLIAVGVAFWTTNGFVGVPELVPIPVQLRLQRWAGSLGTARIDVTVVLAAGVAIAVIVAMRRRRRHRTSQSSGRHRA